MKLLRRLARWPWLRRHDAALAEEMEHHRALVQADLEARGVPPGEAAAASRRAMGNVTLAREDARAVWIAAWADALWRDARHGLRGLRREPTFTLTTVLTLALGITTTTTVFSVVDAELWRPLPYPQPEQLVQVYSRGRESRGVVEAIAVADLHAWRSEAPAFSDLAATGWSGRRVLRRDTAESVLVTEVTSNYFTLLGRTPIAGRTFAPGARHEAVLTEPTWRRLFNGDSSVVGRSIVVDDESLSIAGIVAADDSLGPEPDVFVVFDESGSVEGDSTRSPLYGGIGRLRPGATADAARAQLQAIRTRRAQAESDAGVHTIDVEDLRESNRSSNWRPLYFFLGASLVVLVLSAINAATLLLARAASRTREFALRGALGGGPRALAGQLLVEGALLAAPAGALGLLLTAWVVAALATALPESLLQHGSPIPVDARVAGFALAVTGATTAIFALAPMLFARRLDLSSALSQSARTTRSAGEGRARHVLLVGQIALTVTLLAAAGIFVKSFIALTHVPLGFDPANALVVRASLSGPRYATDPALVAYASSALEAAHTVPGVREAAIASSTPLGSGPLVRLVAHDAPRPAPGGEARAIVRTTSPGYFSTLAIRLVRGRDFASADSAVAPRVAIVNETLARQVFGGDDPVGRVLDFTPGGSPRWAARVGHAVVVGVAANIKEVGLNEIDFGDIYLPYAQAPEPFVELVVRAAVPASTIADALRQRMAHVDPAIPVTGVRTFDERVAHALEGDRFNFRLVGTFAALAILLAAIGVYGAVAYSVQTRTREFGVRLALGARPGRLVGAAIGRAASLGAIGGVLGVASALVIAILIGSALYVVPGEHEGMLFGVTTTDPTILASAFAGIVVIAIAAGTIPARRVARVDPVLALRND
ncbi:MAG TPA: ADOP family duplicated permease [Vicinamibacterales bacterium]|nr:ADOP family duplicated permease [Vicinamibacterales bacterium]